MFDNDFNGIQMLTVRFKLNCLFPDIHCGFFFFRRHLEINPKLGANGEFQCHWPASCIVNSSIYGRTAVGLIILDAILHYFLRTIRKTTILVVAPITCAIQLANTYSIPDCE